jgi:type I restriction enzyme S subunit
MSDIGKVGLKDVIKNPIRDFGSFSLTNLINFVESGIPFIKSEAIQNGYIDFSQLAFITEEVHKLLSKSIVNKGDVLFTKIGAIGRGAIYDGRLGVCNSNAASAKITINEVVANSSFILHILLSEETKRFFEKRIISTPPRLNLKDLYELRFPMPVNTIEQDKIASILTTIDCVIERTEAAIEKYKSIKQGMMQDLFTRGIDAKTGKLRPKHEDAPELYKKTKLGLIPKEWEITNNLISTYIKGRIGWEGLKASEFISEGPHLVTGTDLINGKVNWSTCYHIGELRFQEAPSIHLQNDDLLITKDGSIGKTAIVENCPQKAILNSGLFVLRCKDESYYNKFLYYILNTEIFYSHLRKTQGGSTINHLYQREFEKFEFPIPHKSEQMEIINTLINLEKKIWQEENYLSKMKYIKNGLMQDLLTGKKRVKVEYGS